MHSQPRHGFQQHARLGLARRLTAALSSVALVFGLAVAAGVGTGVSNADPASLDVSKEASAQVLVGSPITYTLKATNNTGAPLYNLSFRDVLPAGATYTGPTTPASIGAPQQIAEKDVDGIDTGRTVLIWSNVSDLPMGAVQSFTFTATPSTSTYPVGATVPNEASGYANTDERTVPKFAGNDVAAAASSYTASGDSGSVSTRITAIKIEKSEPSPENELMRGVHDRTTVYTLTVTNNGTAATNGIKVVDYLPAALEFLGCGTEDNTSNGGVEYPAASRLDATDDVAGCTLPESVLTIQVGSNELQKPDGTYLPSGVYTQVTWAIGTLGTNGTAAVTYAAGIPQRENTLVFLNDTDVEYLPADVCDTGTQTCPQAANLDNNTGPSTREQDSAPGSQGGERGLTNLAVASGTYTGTVFGSGSPEVQASDIETVTSEDLAIHKSVSPGTFTQGGIATYTLTVRTSEYTDASGIVVTDVIPDGLCPLKSGSTTECATDGGVDLAVSGSAGTSATSLIKNADGTWTVVFAAFDQGHDTPSTTISYQALMGTNYVQHSSAPTVSGDDYTNHVSLVGTTTTRNDVEAPLGDEIALTAVRDASEATITSGGPALTKTIRKQSTTVTPYECTTGTYVGNGTDPATSPDLTFHVGDRVCFTVRVQFDAGSSTRNPVITDFLPDYVAYETGTAAKTGADTASQAGLAPTINGDDQLVWKPGTPSGGGSDLYVARGAVFEWTLAATVTKDPATSTGNDITGNLAKLTWTSTGGTVGFLRDQVDFSASKPVIDLEKAVATVNGASAGASPAVHDGDAVAYAITLTNTGRVDAVNTEIVDELPAGVACDDITVAASDGGTCVGGKITWTGVTVPAADAAANPGTKTLTYTITVPDGTHSAPVAAGSVLTNTSYVTKYQGPPNNGDNLPGTGEQYYTPDNKDGKTGADVNADPAKDTATITLDAPTIAKTGESLVQTDKTMATIGEPIKYTVTTTIPAHVTLYDAMITDDLSTRLAYCGTSTATVCPADVTGTMTVTGGGGPTTLGSSVAGQTPGVALDGTAIKVTFPHQFTTTAETVVVFTFYATVEDVSGNAVGGIVLSNKAWMAWKTSGGSAANGSPLNSNIVNTVILEPKLGVTKTEPHQSDADFHYQPGDTVTYTVTVTNSGTSAAHDVVVTDSVPTGMDSPTCGTTPTDWTCAVDTGASPKTVTWTLDTTKALPHSGANSAQFTFTATIPNPVIGSATYENKVHASATSLHTTDYPGARTENSVTNASRYKADATRTISLGSPSIAKGVDQVTAYNGQDRTFTVTVTVPTNMDLPNLTVVDTLPTGMVFGAYGDMACDASGTDCAGTGGVAFVPLAAAGGKVAWYLGNVETSAGERVITLEYTARAAKGTAKGAALKNTAVLYWDALDNPSPPASGGPIPPDPNTTFTHKTDPVDATITTIAPVIAVTKTVSKSNPAPGEEFTYTITVTNNGNSAAHDVALVDTLPAKLDWAVTATSIQTATVDGADVMSTPGAPAYDAATGTLSWSIPQLEATKSAVVTFKTKFGPSSALTAAAIANTATVTEYYDVPRTTYDGDPTRYEKYGPASGPRNVTPSFPHFVATKTAAGGSPAYIDGEYLWRFTITNTGSATGYKVGATDVLPPNWTYVTGSATYKVDSSASASLDDSKLNDTANSGTHTLTWTDIADLNAGSVLTVEYKAKPGPDVVTSPGVGSTHPHTNSVTPYGEDATGATGNSTGSYSGSGVSANTVIHSADVTVEKTVGVAPVAGRNTATWTLTVKNLGPDTAVPGAGGFTVTDDTAPPTGFTLTGVSGAGWNCSASNLVAHHVSCTRNNVAENLTGSFPAITVTYEVAADVAVGTTYPNSATVSGSKTYDPNDPSHGTDNNTSSATATVVVAADLGIGKTLVGSMTAGEDATYEIVVHNYGPSDSQSLITVADDIPAGTTFVSASGTGWACTTPAAGASTGTISCTHGLLANGADAEKITVVVHVDSGRTTNVVNKATVTPTTGEGDNTHSNESQVTTLPGTSADLKVAKAHAPGDTYVPGTDIHYTITVTNDGPSDAAAPVVTDVLPSYLTYQTAGGTGWNCTYTAGTRTVTCTATGPLANGATAAAIDLVVRLSSASAEDDDIANTAKVTSTTPDPNDSTHGTDNNSSTDTKKAAEPSADLKIEKAHTGDFLAGESGQYTLTVTNLGPSDAAGPLTVTDTLPAGMTLKSSAGAGWSACAEDPGDPQKVTCTRSAALAAGGSDSNLTITVDVAPTVLDGTVLTNTVSVSSPTPDPVPGNNDDDDPTTITTGADLGIDKSIKDGYLVAGFNATYEIVVTNYGPSDSAGPITVTDEVPDGTTFVSASGTDWACAPATDIISGKVTVTCTRAKVLPFTTAAGNPAPTIALVVKVDDDRATEVANSAAVAGTTPEPTGGTPHPNTDDAKQTPDPSADLKITKVHDPADSFQAGNDIHYTIAVENLGEFAARTPTVKDSLPAVFDPATIAFSNDVAWACTVPDSVGAPLDIECVALADLAKGDSISFTVAATLKADYHRSAVANTAEVTSTTPDTDESDNEATDRWNPPPPPSAPTSTTPVTTTPVTVTSPPPTTTTVPPTTLTTPTIPTVVPSSATSVSTPPPPTNVPAITTNVPEPNQCVDLVEHGFDPGETVTITVSGPDGQYTIRAVADANGDVAFCLQSAVPVRVVIEVLGEHHVVVREVVLGIGGELPNTGVPVVKYLTLALLLLAAGAALVLFGGHRRQGRHSHG